jgi:hypothetical protein
MPMQAHQRQIAKSRLRIRVRERDWFVHIKVAGGPAGNDQVSDFFFRGRT